MNSPVYTAHARVTGGRADGRGRTPGGELDLRLRMPKELGGNGDGANPEQLFAIGYAACFEAAMTFAARRLGLRAESVTDVTVDARVMLLASKHGGFRLGAELDVDLPSIDDAVTAADLVRATHRICPYSNATRGNIDVAMTVNGVAVESVAEPAAAG